MNRDKAGKSYWNHAWENTPLLKAVDPHARGLNNYVNRKFHEYFCQAFCSMDTRGKRLLEIGCARSAWLPYFGKEFGFKIYGIDYSEIGCQQAMQVLSNEGVQGKVMCADFFSPPESMLEKFDVVVSFGVVEHFEDTAACIKAFSKFLKPNGIMITNIPNMVGLNGLLQKRLHKQIYDIHMLLTKEGLINAHIKAGLEIIQSDYFLPANFSVINIHGWKKRGATYKVIVHLRSWFSKAVWIAEGYVPIVRSNWLTSPYINCIAQKSRT